MCCAKGAETHMNAKESNGIDHIATPRRTMANFNSNFNAFNGMECLVLAYKRIGRRRSICVSTFTQISIGLSANVENVATVYRFFFAIRITISDDGLRL